MSVVVFMCVCFELHQVAVVNHGQEHFLAWLITVYASYHDLMYKKETKTKKQKTHCPV